MVISETKSIPTECVRSVMSETYNDLSSVMSLMDITAVVSREDAARGEGVEGGRRA